MTRYTEPVQITFVGGATLTFRAPEAGVIEVEGLQKSTGQKLMEAAQSPTFFYELFGLSAPGADLPDPHEANTPAPGAEQAVAAQGREPEYLRALAPALELLGQLEARLAEGLTLPEGRARRVQTTFRAEVNGQPFTKEDWVEVRDPLDPSTRNTLVQRWESSLRRDATTLLLEAARLSLARGVCPSVGAALLLQNASPEAHHLCADAASRRGARFTELLRAVTERSGCTPERLELTQALWEERRFDSFALDDAREFLRQATGRPYDRVADLGVALLPPSRVTYALVIAQIPHAQL